MSLQLSRLKFSLPVLLLAACKDDGVALPGDTDPGTSADSGATTVVSAPATDTDDPPEPTTASPATTTPDDTTSTTSTTSSTTSDETTSVDTDGFDPQGAFGDGEFGVQEMDLVGAWSLHWDPAQTAWTSELTIHDDGTFVWRETTDSCAAETLASGRVWVEGFDLVLHVDVWERALPFTTLEALGEEFPPPFRLRMGYSLQGLYLGLAAPAGITTPEPYAGRTWARYFADDDWLAGEWQLESELTAIPTGKAHAIVVVREVYQALLDPAFNTTPVEGTGELLHARTYWGVDPPKTDPAMLASGDYVCIGACDQPAGAAEIDGDFHVYGPYAGAQRLMTFASGKAWKRDVPPACP